MIINIEFKKDHTYFQFNSEKIDVYLKGHCIYNNKYYSKNEFVELLIDKFDSNNLIELLEKLDGNFIIALISNNILFFAVDSLRSIPLFYSYNNEMIVLSDDASILKNIFNLNSYIDSNIIELIYISLVSGNNTILENLFQLDSGQYGVYDINKNTIRLNNYFYYIYSELNCSDSDTLSKQIKQIEANTFNNLVNSLQNRTAVVPLSGGYDSRYIVAMLHKCNYKNVICFTYGKKDSFEVSVSQKVAEALNYKWFFIEYNESIIEDTVQDDLFLNYMLASANYSSTPHFQDYIAVKYLKENNLIPDDSIFIPGHSGDLLGGSHLRNLYNAKIRKEISDEKDPILMIIDHWYKDNFNIHKNVDFTIYSNRIEKYFKDLNFSNIDIPEYLVDCWDISNRQGKFIINSCRVYEFFNYEFRLPLWHKDFSLFWLSLPLELKINKLFYNDYLLNNIFNKYNIEYPKDTLNPKYKNIFIKIFGKYIFKKITHLLFLYKKDINSFDLFNRLMNIDISIQFDYVKSHIDQVSASWYLTQILKNKDNDNNN